MNSSQKQRKTQWLGFRPITKQKNKMYIQTKQKHTQIFKNSNKIYKNKNVYKEIKKKQLRKNAKIKKLNNIYIYIYILNFVLQWLLLLVVHLLLLLCGGSGCLLRWFRLLRLFRLLLCWNLSSWYNIRCWGRCCCCCYFIIYASSVRIAYIIIINNNIFYLY